VALDVASGAVVWRQRIDAPGIGAPAVADGTVYVAGRDGSGWAISAAEGKVVWQVAGTPGAAGFLGAAAPTVGPRQVWFPTGSGDVMAVLRTGGGVKVWQSSLAGKRPGRAHALTPDVTGDPVLAGNTLYAGTAAGRTVALDAGTGDKLWTAGEGAMGPLALAGGALFVVTDEARLARIDAATGEVIWSVEMPYFEQEKPKRRKAITAHYGPVLAGGRVVVASSDGLLRGFDPASGALVHTAEIPGGAAAHPAVAGGTLFVAGTNGQLHAFR
jgi:outer membrane protein assembly factor BamB